MLPISTRLQLLGLGARTFSFLSSSFPASPIRSCSCQERTWFEAGAGYTSSGPPSTPFPLQLVPASSSSASFTLPRDLPQILWARVICHGQKWFKPSTTDVGPRGFSTDPQDQELIRLVQQTPEPINKSTHDQCLIQRRLSKCLRRSGGVGCRNRGPRGQSLHVANQEAALTSISHQT